MNLKPLREKSRIAIAAPAGPFNRRSFLKAVLLLQKLGFRVVYRNDIFSKNDYRAGSDERRLSELKQYLTDGKSEALLFARGGYGTQPLLSGLPSSIKPKIVVGLSDLTVLLLFLWKKYRLPSLYGPLVVPHLAQRDNLNRLRRALTDPEYFLTQPLKARTMIRSGKEEGILVGGCLSLIISTLGTPWEIETRGRILFLEDTHEEPYAIDRMLTQLKQAGKFEGVKGIALGTFRLGKTLFPRKILEVFHERLSDFKGPILWGLPFGHCPTPLLIPFGGRGRIEKGRLLFTRGIF